MRRFIGLSVCAFFLATCPTFAQQILPHAVGSWTGTVNNGPPARPASLTSFIPIVDPSILAEYDWVSSESVNYAPPMGEGPENLQATVFQMKDPTGGYGLYSYLRTADMAHADFTEHSSASSGRALVLIGNLVLDVERYDPAKDASLVKSLVAALAPHAQDGPLPTLWQYLPAKDLVPRSDHYILGPNALNQFFPGGLGDSLGFKTGAEAELARYRLEGHDATLLVVDLPTPQLAQQRLDELERKFNVNGPNQQAPLFAKRTRTLLVIVSGLPLQAAADTLLSQVSGGAELTWDEPTFQFKEPSIEVMIVGSIIGTGLICLFALIAGLSFGGFRLIVKRFWPGKVFDRSSHLQVLQLGLGSKPINSDDFYGYSTTTTEEGFVQKNLPDRIALRIFR